jgi:hypothetical protein
MKWYHYSAAFFAGVFLVNAVPRLPLNIENADCPPVRAMAMINE